ncbi:hypothetical protein [Flavobacterium aestivum]|uniref:hypothetical protein n=1 Tax=Flavobacterium aestivum TaxID=3003257 RepID=UPI00228673AA|nr:hypothetical protein [Flavobacterium aestivum]
MEFEYIKNYYKVPADMFREVLVNGKKGVITKDQGNYIGVVFYDDKKLMALPCHPTWKVEYLETFNYKPPKPKNLASKNRYQHYLSLDSDMSFFEYLKSPYSQNNCY